MYTFDDFVNITKQLHLSYSLRDRFPLQNDLTEDETDDDEINVKNCVLCNSKINSVFETGTCWYCNNDTCQDCFIKYAQDDNLVNMISCNSCQKSNGVSCAPLLVKENAGTWALKSIGVEDSDNNEEEEEEENEKIEQEIGIVFGVGKEIDELMKQINELSAAAAIDQIDFLSKINENNNDENEENETEELNFEALKQSAASWEQSDSLKQDKIDLYTRVLKALNWIRDIFPSFFWGHYISTWFRAVAFRAQLENDDLLFERIRDHAPDAFLDIGAEPNDNRSTLSLPEEDSIQHHLYPCAATLPLEFGVDLRNETLPIESLMLSATDIQAFNEQLQSTAEHEGTAGGEADPSFDGLCGQAWKMKVWSPPASEQHRHRINRIIDIRWVFPSYTHAALYHGLRLGENSEGQKPVSEPSFSIGKFCHVFGGTTVFQVQQQEVSMTLYILIFRVKNVVYKLLVSQGVQSSETLSQETVYEIAKIAVSNK